LKKIRTSTDYEAALARINALMGATPHSPEQEELALLADLVEEFETTHALPAAAPEGDVG
jgi:antitoxin component HigA of HigAB toxin-antitoxin module